MARGTPAYTGSFRAARGQLLGARRKAGHRGAERSLVLEGSYTDSNRVRVGPGDEQELAAGSELVIAPEGPCIAGVVEQGLEFSGPVLRLLGRWFSL